MELENKYKTKQNAQHIYIAYQSSIPDIEWLCSLEKINHLNQAH